MQGEGHLMRSICVFCGSNPGANAEFSSLATAFGKEIAKQGLTLVYGGGKVGLMGAVADAALEHGGRVNGVIPEFLARKEVAHQGVTELEVVETMHQRKMRMFEQSDAFVALPGGLGTLEEIFEVVTWAQLGFHRKPCGFLNVAGYYDDLLSFLDTCTEQRFVKGIHRRMLLVETDPGALIAAVQRYEGPIVDKWIDSPTEL